MTVVWDSVTKDHVVRPSGVRPAGARKVLRGARLRPDHDVWPGLGRTPLPAEGDPRHRLRIRHGPAAGFRWLRGREVRRRQGARTAGIHGAAEI